MTEQDQPRRADRRAFFKQAGLAGVATAGAAIATLVDAPPVRSATDTPPRRRSAGYHETDHVRKAYALSRF
jgi:hypothetical protein